MNFPERLKLLIKEKNINRATLSKQCNISYTTISGWLKGHRPLPSALKILSNYFNVSTDYLLGYTDIKLTNEQKEINKEEKQIIEKYSNANQETKIIIKKILNIV